jgi:hypothetical protein
MLFHLSTFQSLVGPGTYVSKAELIKRYRRVGRVNYYWLQILYMLPFVSVGKDEEGRLYFY